MNRPSGTKPPPYTEAQSKAWLIWLARNMQAHGKTVFMLEELQPSWLLTRKQRITYMLGSRMILGLGFNLVVGAIFGLIMKGGKSDSDSFFDWMLACSISGISLGFVSGITDSYRMLRTSSNSEIAKFKIQFQFASDRPIKEWTKNERLIYISLHRKLVFRSLVGISLSLALVAPLVPVAEYSKWIQLFVIGLLNKASCLQTEHFTAESTTSLETDIYTIETTTWSWRDGFHSLRSAFPVFCSVLLVIAMSGLALSIFARLEENRRRIVDEMLFPKSWIFHWLDIAVDLSSQLYLLVLYSSPQSMTHSHIVPFSVRFDFVRFDSAA